MTKTLKTISMGAVDRFIQRPLQKKSQQILIRPYSNANIKLLANFLPSGKKLKN